MTESSRGPRVLLLNGAFGVGKTTVARLLVRRLPGSGIFDPERLGFVLRHLPRRLPGSTRHLADYQDSATWRRKTAQLIGWAARLYQPVIVPMCFRRIEYLSEIRRHLERRRLSHRHLCLVAPERTVISRLLLRRVDPLSAAGEWVFPRALDACRQHRRTEFATTIDTDDRAPADIAAEIAWRLAEPAAHSTGVGRSLSPSSSRPSSSIAASKGVGSPPGSTTG
ncbi:MAG: AAA family ATPase [Acidobacteriota bacterium]